MRRLFSLSSYARRRPQKHEAGSPLLGGDLLGHLKADKQEGCLRLSSELWRFCRARISTLPRKIEEANITNDSPATVQERELPRQLLLATCPPRVTDSRNSTFPRNNFGTRALSASCWTTFITGDSR